MVYLQDIKVSKFSTICVKGKKKKGFLDRGGWLFCIQYGATSHTGVENNTCGS